MKLYSCLLLLFACHNALALPSHDADVGSVADYASTDPIEAVNDGGTSSGQVSPSSLPRRSEEAPEWDKAEQGDGNPIAAMHTTRRINRRWSEPPSLPSDTSTPTLRVWLQVNKEWVSEVLGEAEVLLLWTTNADGSLKLHVSTLQKAMREGAIRVASSSQDSQFYGHTVMGGLTVDMRERFPNTVRTDSEVAFFTPYRVLPGTDFFYVMVGKEWNTTPLTPRERIEQLVFIRRYFQAQRSHLEGKEVPDAFLGADRSKNEAFFRIWINTFATE